MNKLYIITKLLALALVIALLPSPLVLAEGGIQIDADPEGGYTGDYVLIYNDDFLSGTSLTSGFMTGLIETDIPQFGQRVPDGFDINSYKSKVVSQPDPYLEQTQTQDSSLPFGEVGFIKAFVIPEGLSPGRGDIDFQVIAAGQHCRVWSPLNPDYYPLEAIDPTAAEELAAAFDGHYDFMTRVFGAPVNLPGDGIINLMCYNVHEPTLAAFVNLADLYERISVGGKQYQSNALAMLHLDTYAPPAFCGRTARAGSARRSAPPRLS